MLNTYYAWGVYGEEAMREGVRLDSTKVHVMLCLYAGGTDSQPQ